MNRFYTAIGAIALVAVSLSSTSAASPAAESEAGGAEGEFVVREDYVGVENAEVRDAIAQGASVVTWIGEPDGSTFVLWVSDKSVELTDSDENPLEAHFVGPLSDADAAAVEGIVGMSNAAASAGVTSGGGGTAMGAGPPPVCSLVVGNPWVNLAATPDTVNGATVQVCVGMTAQRVRDWLYRSLWVFPILVASDDTGVVPGSFVIAVATRGCATTLPKTYRNAGDGDAWQGPTYFDGPSAQTPWMSLGCTT